MSDDAPLANLDLRTGSDAGSYQARVGSVCWNQNLSAVSCVPEAWAGCPLAGCSRSSWVWAELLSLWRGRAGGRGGDGGRGGRGAQMCFSMQDADFLVDVMDASLSEL